MAEIIQPDRAWAWTGTMPFPQACAILPVILVDILKPTLSHSDGRKQ